MSGLRRRPGLDVLRAIAIALVVVHHYRHLPGVPEWLRWVGLRGYVGVDVFFVLSGWLIGGQLFREQAATGRVALGRFWARRWLRTIPAYAAMVSALAVFGRLPLEALPSMVVFAQNYLHPDAWLITWSLCIEEQFYLALPLVVLALGRLPKPLGIAFALLLIVFSPLARAHAWPAMQQGTYGEFLSTFYVRTHLRLEGLFLGVWCAALATAAHPAWERLARHARPAALVGAGLAVAATFAPWLTGWTSNPTERMAFFPAVLGFLGVSVGVALTLPWASDPATRIPGRRGFEWVAEHAYTLYLTHELVRDGVARVLVRAFGSGLPWWVHFGLCVVLACIAAWALRQAVELPFLRWREQVARRGTEVAVAPVPARSDVRAAERGRGDLR